MAGPLKMEQGQLMDCREYKVGRFTLQPFRQLLDGGKPVSIGRKALELLSVLAKAEGALVTKDELMTAVWPNTVVEDNALQVHVAALRKLLGADAELLSTVHGFGYRLAAVPLAAAPKPEAPVQAPSPAALRHLVPIGLAVLLALCLGGGGLWLFRDRLPWPVTPHEPRVAVLPFDTIGSGKELRSLADGLADKIVNQLSDVQIQTVSPTENKVLRGGNAEVINRLGADMVLAGTVQGDGKALDVRVHLDDVREHVVLWFGEYRGTANATEALEASVAAQAADILHWAKVGHSGKVRLDAATLAAFIAGRQSTTGVRNASEGVALADYRKVVAASPDFSWGHSAIAVMEGFELRRHPALYGGNDALRADVWREAKLALALEPQNGEAWTALELSMPPLNWQEREALLLQGIAADPNFEPIVTLEGHLLWALGRGKDAYVWFKRAHDIDPLRVNGAQAWIPASEGRPAESRAVVAQMTLQWPNHPGIRGARFLSNVLMGATDDALAQLADPGARPSGLDQKAVDAWSAALKASASKERAAKAGAVKAVMEAVNTGSLGRGPALMLLAMLGDLDAAFAQADDYEPATPGAPAYLFLPTTAAMRSDPRFMLLAHKLGLVAYWRSTGKWPDFCSEPGLPYDCRVEAEKGLKYVRN